MIPKQIFFLFKDKNNIPQELIENINVVINQTPNHTVKII